MTKLPKRLVIDANIARSAGGKQTQDEVSKGCRDFLMVMRDVTKHKVVTTEAILAEWYKHQSRFTLHWLTSMQKKGRVVDVDIPTKGKLRSRVTNTTSSIASRKAMLKDIHLVEAAFHTDKIVVSMDETVRNCFHEATKKINALTQIAWVNPCKSEETPLEWLKDGAELERERLLGYQREDSDN